MKMCYRVTAIAALIRTGQPFAGPLGARKPWNRCSSARWLHGPAYSQGLTVALLQDRLRDAGLPVSGRKADLVERLASVQSLVGPLDSVPVASDPRSPAAPASVKVTLKAPVTSSRRGNTTEREHQGDVRPQKARARSAIARDPTPRAPPVPAGSSPALRLVSWNVNGLRALLRRPEPLALLLASERPHVLCLQETKLQDMHVAAVERDLQVLPSKSARFFSRVFCFPTFAGILHCRRSCSAT